MGAGFLGSGACPRDLLSWQGAPRSHPSDTHPHWTPDSSRRCVASFSTLPFAPGGDSGASHGG